MQGVVMSQQRHGAHRVLIFTLILLALSLPAYAQDGGEDLGAIKQKAAELLKQARYTEALPLLEKIAAAEPDDNQTQFYLGFALIGQANNTKDAATRKSLRVRAHTAFVRAKELGLREPIVEALIQSMAPDGSEGAPMSANAEADKLMTEAEAFFAQGKFDEALRNYQAALKLDPEIYSAALFS